jgi:hypothetical protein
MALYYQGRFQMRQKNKINSLFPADGATKYKSINGSVKFEFSDFNCKQIVTVSNCKHVKLYMSVQSALTSVMENLPN